MSEKKIVYIKRKESEDYHSIESLFMNIETEVSKKFKCKSINLENSGATPSNVIKNLFSLKKHKCDVYHITGDVHYMALSVKNNGVLTIHDVHSAITGSIAKRFYLKLFWFWLPALFIKRITVISDFTKDELSKLIPFAKKKIRVVPNPVNPNFKFEPKPSISDQPTVLFMGTKTNKNLERCIKALEGVSVQFQIVGKLSDQQKELLKMNNINYSNKFHLSDQEIIQVYKDCDVVCFPSTYEGFGMPIIEAQATGRPVVTSDLGAMKEVAGDSACLVDPYSVQSMRKGIQKVIQDEQYRKRLVEKGKENIKRFEVATVAKQYIEIYEEI